MKTTEQIRYKFTKEQYTPKKIWYSQDEVNKLKLELEENQQISDRISSLIKERDERYTKIQLEQLHKELKDMLLAVLYDYQFDKHINEKVADNLLHKLIERTNYVFSKYLQSSLDLKLGRDISSGGTVLDSPLPKPPLDKNIIK